MALPSSATAPPEPSAPLKGSQSPWHRRAGHYAGVSFILLMLTLPFVAFFFNAFAFRWFYPQLIPTEWSLRAWGSVFSGNSKVLEAFWNSAFIGITVTVLSVIIALPAARALGVYRFRGKRVVEFLMLAPIIVPGLAFTLGLNINFLRLGWSGTSFGVILVHLVPVMPYVVLTLSGVFSNYDTAFEEQARTLGAGPVATFRHVTFPAIFPGIVVASLFAFLVSWSQYVLTLLIGAGQVITLPILLFSTVPGGNNPLIAAMSLVFIAPAVLVLVLTSRFLSGKSTAIGGFGQV